MPATKTREYFLLSAWAKNPNGEILAKCHAPTSRQAWKRFGKDPVVHAGRYEVYSRRFLSDHASDPLGLR